MKTAMQTLIEELEATAKKTAWSDEEDFNAYDCGGGNYDDTYAGGVNDGEVHSARDILEKLRAALIKDKMHSEFSEEKKNG